MSLWLDTSHTQKNSKGGLFMEVTLTTFYWENGSINDQIRSFLRKRKIPYYNTMNGDVMASFYNNFYQKVYAVPIGRDFYKICI